MASVTYEWVFGAPPGQEIREGAMKYRPCPAVSALRTLLGNYTAFQGKLGGQGGYYNEFNRHHAGLAVDIMLSPSVPEQVRLGKQLVMLFIQMKDVMLWRGIIYQHVALNFAGQPTGVYHPSNWDANDHRDHVHIDWHDPGNVTWVQVNQIPLRKLSGDLQMLTPKTPGKVASEIAWTTQAMNDFTHNQSLAEALDDLMNKYDQGPLDDLDLMQATGLVQQGP